MKKFLVFLLVFALSACASASASVRTVKHVSDGDTLILDRGEKVRLIGLDAPEIHDLQRNKTNAWRFKCHAPSVSSYAERSRSHLQRLIEGQQVRLEYDTEKQDKYGRTLAYVYRASDNLFVNAELIKEGQAWAYLRFPFKHAAEFKSYHEAAKAGKTGIWEYCKE